MLRPVPAVAVAVTVVAVFTGKEALALGLEIETVGAATTVTVTAGEVTTLFSESVTRAVTDCDPAVVGTQVPVYGDEFADATTLVPTRNSTATTVAPGLAVGVAASDTVEPMLAIRPAVGAVSDTLAADPVTVTDTALDVTTAPALSVTRAVSERVPLVEGVQLML